MYTLIAMSPSPNSPTHAAGQLAPAKTPVPLPELLASLPHN
jgi:hypothetical protein